MREHLRRVLVLLLAVSVFVGAAPVSALASEIGEQVPESFDSVSDDGALDIEEAETEISVEGAVSSDRAASAGVDFLDGMEIEGADSVGNMLAEKMLDKTSSEMKSNGCNVFSVLIDGNIATVEMETIEDARLVVGIYDEDTDKLVASGEKNVTASDSIITVNIKGSIPKYYMVRAYLIGGDDLAPLCAVCETPRYTKDMQEFLKKTTDDFDQKLVFNYDEDKTKNYLVFNESVIRIQEDGEHNKLVSANETEYIYEFENVNEILTGLSKGDRVAYEYTDNRIIIITVDEVITGNKSGTAIVKGQKNDNIENVFDYIRIDVDTDEYENCITVDDSDMEEGVTFVGALTPEEYDLYKSSQLNTSQEQYDFNEPKDDENVNNSKMGNTYSGSYINTFKVSIKRDDEFGKDKTISVHGEVSGTLGLELNANISYTKTLLHGEFNFEMEYEVNHGLSIIGGVEGKLPLGEVNVSPGAPIANIVFTPSLVLRVEGEFSHNAVSKGIIGCAGYFKCIPNPSPLSPPIPYSIHVRDLSRDCGTGSEAEYSGSIFIGLEFEPSVNLITEDLIELYVSVEAGLEAEVELASSDSITTTKKHLCNNCIDGAVSNVVSGEVGADAFMGILRASQEVEYKLHKFDFYFSKDFAKPGELGEFGIGDCPHVAYLVTGSASSKFKGGGSSKSFGKPIKDVDVKVNQNTVTTASTIDKVMYSVESDGKLFADYKNNFVTDENGVWKGYFENGDYVAQINSQGFIPLSIPFKVEGKATHIDADLEAENDNKDITLALGYESAIIDPNGDLWMWGPGLIFHGGAQDYHAYPVKIMENVEQVSLGGDEIAAIDSDKNLWIWKQGHVWNITEDKPYTPVKLKKNITQVSMGDNHGGAIDTDGNLWMWGDNQYGQLGNDTHENSSQPVKVKENVTQLSLGFGNSGAIDKDGNLWMWGNNESGQLGDGTTISSAIPVKIKGNVSQVGLGDFCSAALDKDGNVWIWGSWPGLFASTPNSLDDMGKIQRISIGGGHGGAIDTDGNLWMWGVNGYGQVGDGTEDDRSIPIKVLKNVKQISMGSNHSGAIDKDGNLWMWGGNQGGQIDEVSYRNIPNPVNITIEYLESNSYSAILNCDEIIEPEINEFCTAKINALGIPIVAVDGRVDISGLYAGKIYNFYAVKNKTAKDILDTDNLLYMAQGMTDGTGALSFDYVPREEVSDPELFVVAARDPVRSVSVNGVSLDKVELPMKKGDTRQLKATVAPEDASNKTVTWESSDLSVATVDNTGKVTAVADGTATVTVKTVDGEYPAFCFVVVNEEGGGVEPEVDDTDGIKEGDLPAGKEIPEGVWIGGLKSSYPYTGNAVKPEIRVYNGSKRLTAGTDYTLAYKGNKAVGNNASIIVKFKGDIKGSRKVTFKIEKNPLTDVSYEENALSVPYKAGKKNNNIKPVLMMDGVKLKYSKNDFEYKYLDAAGQESDCIEKGDYTVRMTAKASSKGYSGYIDVPFTVTDKTAMGKVVITTSKKSFAYTGERQMPTFTLKYNGNPLGSGTYSMVEIEGDNYTEPGTHTVIFRGNGIDVIGSKRVSYKITGKRSLENKLTLAVIAPASLDSDGKVPYANGGAKPKLKISYNGITLKEGRDYTLSYKANKSAGVAATVTAKGKGNYTGSVPVNFTVSQRDLASLLLTVGDRAESNKDNDFKKAVILFTNEDYTDQKLKDGRDYTVEYTTASGSIRPAAGETVSVLIKAKDGGNYKGQVTASYHIIEKAKDLSRAKVKINDGKAYDYTGKAIEPKESEIDIKLDGKTVGTDKYEVVGLYNNVRCSKNAVVLIRGKDELGGIKAVKFKIGASPLERFWRGLIGG